MTIVWKRINSLSLCERAGVRGEAKRAGVFLLLPSTLTLTASQGEREHSR